MLKRDDDSDAMDVEDDGPMAGGKNVAAKKRAVVVKKQQPGKGGKKGLSRREDAKCFPAERLSMDVFTNVLWPMLTRA